MQYFLSHWYPIHRSSRPIATVTTRSVMLSYMQAQIEVVRQQSADTALEMRSELASIKDLQGFLTQKQSIAEQSNSHSDPGGSSSGVSNRVPRDAEPPDITDTTLIRPQHGHHRAPSVPGGLTTRLTKIYFPKFDGTLLKEWLSLCKQFFSLDNTPPELKVRLASHHLVGKVLKWHHNFMRTRFD